MNLLEIMRLSDDAARAYLETVRWPDGARCPHCGSESVGRIQPKKGSKTRQGLWKCYAAECGQQFTVTVGTVMESTHIPLGKWIVAFHLMASSKKGMSACQIQRTLGITYKSAWFMCHRIREAMKEEPLKGEADKFAGTVEIDETFVGGKPRNPGSGYKTRPDRKTPVVALVERDGRLRADRVERVDKATVRSVIAETVDPSARVITDQAKIYRGLDHEFAGRHYTVNHSRGEYAWGDVTTNTAESFFALVKRAHYGTHHHYSRRHLHRYITERQFMWNGRKMTDSERRNRAIKGAQGKRLMYASPRCDK
jgi:transposase-like protein